MTNRNNREEEVEIAECFQELQSQLKIIIICSDRLRKLIDKLSKFPQFIPF